MMACLMSEFCRRAAIQDGSYLLVRDPSAATVGESGMGSCVTVLQTLEPMPDAPIVCVKGLTGQWHRFQIHEDMDLDAVRNYLVRVERLPVERQRIIWHGHQLECPEILLRDYGIGPDHCLHLVSRLLG